MTKKLYHQKYIYKITNLINNKCYIGLTNNYIKRFLQHRGQHSKENIALYHAFDKYGIDNFTFEVIELVSNYNEREQYWIEFYNSMIPNGYNMIAGGDAHPVYTDEDNYNCCHSDEEITQIINLIKNTNLPFDIIAKKFHYQDSGSIERINNGVMRFRKDEQYPLRKELTLLGHKDKARLIIQDLLNTNLTSYELAKKYNMARSAITAINLGINCHFDDISYPVRSKPITSKRIQQIDIKTFEVIHTYDSVTEAATILSQQTGSSMHSVRSYLGKCLNNKCNSAYGYYWKKEN